MMALQRATSAALLLWWLPTILLVVARPTLSRAGFSYRAQRAHRLMEVGDLVEADRVIARLRWEVERGRRRVDGSVTSTTHGDLVDGAGHHLSKSHSDEAGTGHEPPFEDEQLKEEDGVVHRFAETVLVDAEIVRNPASTVIDVIEKARHQLLRPSSTHIVSRQSEN